MEWIENQPVFFGDIDQCTEEEFPAQLVDQTDTTQFQFLFEPCTTIGDQVAISQDPSDSGWIIGGTWSTLVPGPILYAGGTGVNVAQCTFPFVEGDGYTFTMDVSVSIGGINVYLGSTLLGTITESGIYTFSGVATASLLYSTQLYFEPLTSDTTLYVITLAGYEATILNNIIVAIYDNEDNYQGQISEANNPDSFVFTDTTVTITVDWESLELEDGCYYFCVLDPCVNTNGQNYQANISLLEEDWTYGEDWTYTDGVFVGDFKEGNSLVQENVFSTYTPYCIEVTATSITGTINVYFGTALVGTITAPGTTTITGTPAGNLNLSFTTTQGSDIEIINITSCEPDTSQYVCDFQSNTFKLGDYSNECTLLINACNNEDGLGFVFDGSGFSPSIRLESKLRQAKYSNERTIYEDSLGKKKNVYFSGRKQKNLCIDRQPEYVHDFLRLLLGFDNVYINSLPYFVDDDEYNVEYLEQDDSLGKVKLLVSPRTQDTKNINCTDIENVCNLPANYKEFENGDLFEFEDAEVYQFE